MCGFPQTSKYNGRLIMSTKIETKEDFIKALDNFRDRYNKKFYSFELAQLKLYNLIQNNDSFIDENIRKRVTNFIEVIRRKGQIIEF